MIDKLKKAYNRLHNYWLGLFWGMKSVNDTVFTQAGLDNPVGTTINQEVNENRVSKDLLKGEVTQQVEELRYRTYKVDREAKQYEYYSPTKAIRYDKQDSKFVKYDDSDGLPLITIQPNHSITESVYDGIKDIDFLNEKVVDEENNVAVDMGHFDVDEKYNIEIERDFNPRFRLERYTTRLVVKKKDDKDNVVLDFYVSKYPKEKDMKSIYFVKEVEKMLSSGERSDLTSMKRVSFVTSHAYGLYDMLQFKFDHIFYMGISEFDGHYILRFRAHAFVNGRDLTDEYYSESMAKKYEEHEKKEVVMDLSGGFKEEEFVCSECGKTVTYSTDAIEDMPVTLGRDITEDGIDVDSGVMSYMDLQISEQTFGKRLCKDCLRSYLNNMDNVKVEE